MPSFAHPALLLTLTLLPALAWAWSRTRRPAIRYPTLTLLDGLAATSISRGRLILRLVAVGLLLLAAAGPRVPDYATPIPVPGIAIQLVIDVSGSMAERDFPGAAGMDSRLIASQAAARDFVAGGAGFPGRPTDRVGLVSFAELPRTVAPPTFSHAPLLGQLADLESTAGIAAGTSIGDALAEALDRVATAPGRKIIVLVTDGEENAGGRADALEPLRAARLAEALGVPIYAVDCSPPSGDSTGPDLLARMARLSGGQSFRGADAEAVRTALRAIDDLERVAAPPPRYRRYRDYTGHVASLGVVLLSLASYWERTRWAVTP